MTDKFCTSCAFFDTEATHTPRCKACPAVRDPVTGSRGFSKSCSVERDNLWGQRRYGDGYEYQFPKQCGAEGVNHQPETGVVVPPRGGRLTIAVFAVIFGIVNFIAGAHMGSPDGYPPLGYMCMLLGTLAVGGGAALAFSVLED